MVLKQDCPIRNDGRCLDRVKMSFWEQFFASSIGSFPAALIILVQSEFFHAFPKAFEKNTFMMTIIFIIFISLWIGLIWIVANNQYRNHFDYFLRSTAYFSSFFGLSATFLSDDIFTKLFSLGQQ